MKTKLTLLILTISLLGYLQSIRRSVLASVGYIEGSGNFNIHATVGQPIAGTLQSNSNYLRQGFQQPLVKTSGVNIVEEENTSFSVYPNPFSEQAFLEYLSDDSYLVTIYDAKGKKVQEIKGNGAETTTIYRNSLAPGVYFVYVEENGDILGREKLIVTD